MTSLLPLSFLDLPPTDQPVLLYAGTCPSCRLMAGLVLGLASGSILGRSLDEPEWRRFYDEVLPQSRGSPVLLQKGAVYWGGALYARVLWLALRGGLSACLGRWPGRSRGEAPRRPERPR